MYRSYWKPTRRKEGWPSYLARRGKPSFDSDLSLMNQVVQPGQLQNKITTRFENGFARTGLFVIGQELRYQQGSQAR
jgi:hypothetical protein